MTVTGTHTYAEEGSLSGEVSVTYVCPSGGMAATRGTFSIQVADAPLTATGAALSGVQGQAMATTVATFTDADSQGVVADYTAAINWATAPRPRPARSAPPLAAASR